uniref:Uncharacterized protein n=1 Tax=Pararge aegeria TaxID=116150 RepID=S4NSH8_9NEOP
MRRTCDGAKVNVIEANPTLLAFFNYLLLAKILLFCKKTMNSTDNYNNYCDCCYAVVEQYKLVSRRYLAMFSAAWVSDCDFERKLTTLVYFKSI